MVKVSKIQNIFKKWLTRRVLVHAIFWFLLLSTLTLLDWRSGGNDAGFAFYLSNQVINIFFYAVIYYLNAEFLIPTYLSKNRLWTYVILISGLAVLITPIKIYFLFEKFAEFPERQRALVSDQGYFYLISLMTAGGSTVVKIFSDWAKQLRVHQEMEVRTIQSELSFLKSQINPHFLFNTLNSLYALTLKKSDEAPEIVIKLSEMMRYMLYECNERQVLLSKEIDYIQNYLDLEALRHKQMDIQFELQGEAKDLKIAPLIFIAFIENAFKHGANNQISKGFVQIQMVVDGDEVNMYVENSKVEKMPTIEHKRTGGIGLVNVKRRLDILYPKNYNLEIFDAPNTYGVNLWIKLNATPTLDSATKRLLNRVSKSV
jgi:two-component system, LytTR family, sensor kinase